MSDSESLTCDRCGRYLPCRHCGPVGNDGLTDGERAEHLAQWRATIAARPSPMEVAAARGRYRSSVQDLIEASSLGTPEAKRLRASVPDEVVADVMRRLGKYAKEGDQ